LRVRTEARRRAILEAARDVFEEHGFERASMQMISERLGGSKATLYGYFPSKEELFLAAIEEDIELQSGEIVEGVRAIEDVREALLAFGRRYVSQATSKRPAAVFRMVANQPAESGVGLRFYERGLRQGWIKVSIWLGELMVAGKLRRSANGWVATMHLKGMLESEYVERRILNAMPKAIDKKTVDRIATDAVDAFLRAYGPET
jgi:AcrR family transcriptional regulator